MLDEDLRSKKFEAYEEYMESKGKRKKPTGKKKGKKWDSNLIYIMGKTKAPNHFRVVSNRLF